MKHFRLTNTAFAKLGFTDAFRITQADLTTAVNNTAQSITLVSLVLGDYIYQPKSLVSIITPGATLATYTAELGITGATTQIIGVSDVKAAAATGYAPANTVAAYAVPSAKDVLLTFRPGAAEALASGTALDVMVWMFISRLKERETGIQF